MKRSDKRKGATQIFHAWFNFSLYLVELRLKMGWYSVREFEINNSGAVSRPSEERNVQYEEREDYFTCSFGKTP